MRGDDGVALGGFDNRFPIGTDFSPHQSKQYVIEMNAPTPPGQYYLEVDLVQEMVAWFSSKHTKRGELRIAVNGPDVSSARVASSVSTAPAASAGVIYTFRAGAFDPFSVSGFHSAEPWGVWSNADPAVVKFPAIKGPHAVTIVARSLVNDKNNVVRITFGAERQEITLGAEFRAQVLHFKLPSGAERLVFQGVQPTPATAFGDPRPLGFALARIELKPE